MNCFQGMQIEKKERKRRRGKKIKTENQKLLEVGSVNNLILQLELHYN